MKNNKGFSVIELVAVLAIIAIVVSIATPKIFKSISNSKSMVCYLNRDKLIKDYRLQLILNPKLNFEDYLTNSNKYFEKDISCPNGPSYTYDDNKIICEKHGVMYINIAATDYVYYPFFDSGFDNTLIEDIIFHEEDDWGFSEQNNNTYYTNKVTGQNRFFLKNNLESYRITTNAILDGYNGYGIFFDTKTNNQANDTGYVFQFDYGYNDGEFIFRKRTYGYESAPILRISPDTIYEQFDNSYWHEEHKITIEVVKISDAEKQVRVFIDDTEITKEGALYISTIDSENKYFGFRTWGDSRVYIRDVKIDKLN